MTNYLNPYSNITTAGSPFSNSSNKVIFETTEFKKGFHSESYKSMKKQEIINKSDP